MRFLLYQIGLALVACSVALASQVQSAGRVAVKRAVITGTVTLKDKPVPGIVIGLMANDSRGSSTPSLKAKTDQEGKYRITNVPSGTYYVVPVSAGFAVADVSVLSGKPVVVTASETIEMDFQLMRGGVITGRVSDLEGKPVIEQRVVLVDSDRNQRGPSHGYHTLTDDRGVYRIFGIAPGRYKVVVGQGQFYVAHGVNAIRRTFYPDVSDESKASVLDLTEGSEISNINITVGREEETFAVSGQVIDGRNGQPVKGATFGLQQFEQHGQHHSSYGNANRSNSKGEFRIEGLLPGKYGISLTYQPGTNLRSNPVNFEIVDSDVTGLVIKTVPGGASVAGVVVVDSSSDRLLLARLPKLTIYGTHDAAPGMALPSFIASDGRFSFDNLPAGSLSLSIGDNDGSSANGFILSRVERNGNVEVGGIEVQEGERITDVRVVLSYGNAIVHGVVKLENGSLPAGAFFTVQASLEGMNTAFGPQQIDERGHFIIEAIPPGLYTFECSIYDPAVGHPGPPVKQRVTITEGVVNEVTITLVNPKRSSTSP
jgi:protocatechuate 3,4-dioxygenase beta subunit